MSRKDAVCDWHDVTRALVSSVKLALDFILVHMESYALGHDVSGNGRRFVY